MHTVSIETLPILRMIPTGNNSQYKSTHPLKKKRYDCSFNPFFLQIFLFLDGDVVYPYLTVLRFPRLFRFT